MTSAGRNLPELRGIAVRLLLILPPLLWLSHAWGSLYGRLWLPWYRLVLGIVMPDYRVANLDVLWRKGEWLVAGQFVNSGYQVVQGQVMPPGVSINASTLLGHALTHPIILITAVVIWPGLNWRSRMFRLMPSLVFLVLLEAVDVPFSMAGAVSDVTNWAASHGQAASSILAGWSWMLDGGGRLALCLAAAVVCAALQGWIEKRLVKPVVPATMRSTSG